MERGAGINRWREGLHQQMEGGAGIKQMERGAGITRRGADIKRMSKIGM